MPVTPRRFSAMLETQREEPTVIRPLLDGRHFDARPLEVSVAATPVNNAAASGRASGRSSGGPPSFSRTPSSASNGSAATAAAAAASASVSAPAAVTRLSVPAFQLQAQALAQSAHASTLTALSRTPSSSSYGSAVGASAYASAHAGAQQASGGALPDALLQALDPAAAEAELPSSAHAGDITRRTRAFARTLRAHVAASMATLHSNIANNSNASSSNNDVIARALAQAKAAAGGALTPLQLQQLQFQLQQQHGSGSGSSSDADSAGDGATAQRGAGVKGGAARSGASLSSSSLTGGYVLGSALSKSERSAGRRAMRAAHSYAGVAPLIPTHSLSHSHARHNAPLVPANALPGPSEGNDTEADEDEAEDEGAEHSYFFFDGVARGGVRGGAGKGSRRASTAASALMLHNSAAAGTASAPTAAGLPSTGARHRPLRPRVPARALAAANAAAAESESGSKSATAAPSTPATAAAAATPVSAAAAAERVLATPALLSAALEALTARERAAAALDGDGAGVRGGVRGGPAGGSRARLTAQAALSAYNEDVEFASSGSDSQSQSASQSRAQSPAFALASVSASTSGGRVTNLRINTGAATGAETAAATPANVTTIASAAASGGVAPTPRTAAAQAAAFPAYRSDITTEDEAARAAQLSAGPRVGSRPRSLAASARASRRPSTLPASAAAAAAATAAAASAAAAAAAVPARPSVSTPGVLDDLDGQLLLPAAGFPDPRSPGGGVGDDYDGDAAYDGGDYDGGEAGDFLAPKADKSREAVIVARARDLTRRRSLSVAYDGFAESGAAAEVAAAVAAAAAAAHADAASAAGAFRGGESDSDSAFSSPRTSGRWGAGARRSSSRNDQSLAQGHGHGRGAAQALSPGAVAFLASTSPPPVHAALGATLRTLLPATAPAAAAVAAAAVAAAAVASAAPGAGSVTAKTGHHSALAHGSGAHARLVDTARWSSPWLLTGSSDAADAAAVAAATAAAPSGTATLTATQRLPGGLALAVPPSANTLTNNGNSTAILDDAVDISDDDAPDTIDALTDARLRRAKPVNEPVSPTSAAAAAVAAAAAAAAAAADSHSARYGRAAGVLRKLDFAVAAESDRPEHGLGALSSPGARARSRAARSQHGRSSVGDATGDSDADDSDSLSGSTGPDADAGAGSGAGAGAGARAAPALRDGAALVAARAAAFSDDPHPLPQAPAAAAAALSLTQSQSREQQPRQLAARSTMPVPEQDLEQATVQRRALARASLLSPAAMRTQQLRTLPPVAAAAAVRAAGGAVAAPPGSDDPDGDGRRGLSSDDYDDDDDHALDGKANAGDTKSNRSMGDDADGSRTLAKAMAKIALARERKAAIAAAAAAANTAAVPAASQSPPAESTMTAAEAAAAVAAEHAAAEAAQAAAHLAAARAREAQWQQAAKMALRGAEWVGQRARTRDAAERRRRRETQRRRALRATAALSGADGEAAALALSDDEDEDEAWAWAQSSAISTKVPPIDAAVAASAAAATEGAASATRSSRMNARGSLPPLSAEVPEGGDVSRVTWCLRAARRARARAREMFVHEELTAVVPLHAVGHRHGHSRGLSARRDTAPAAPGASGKAPRGAAVGAKASRKGKGSACAHPDVCKNSCRLHRPSTPAPASPAQPTEVAALAAAVAAEQAAANGGILTGGPVYAVQGDASFDSAEVVRLRRLFYQNPLLRRRLDRFWSFFFGPLPATTARRAASATQGAEEEDPEAEALRLLLRVHVDPTSGPTAAAAASTDSDDDDSEAKSNGGVNAKGSPAKTVSSIDADPAVTAAASAAAASAVSAARKDAAPSSRARLSFAQYSWLHARIARALYGRAWSPVLGAQLCLADWRRDLELDPSPGRRLLAARAKVAAVTTAAAAAAAAPAAAAVPSFASSLKRVESRGSTRAAAATATINARASGTQKFAALPLPAPTAAVPPATAKVAVTAGVTATMDDSAVSALSLSLEGFRRGLFEISDLWTATVDLTDYIVFLDTLLCKVAVAALPAVTVDAAGVTRVGGVPVPSLRDVVAAAQAEVAEENRRRALRGLPPLPRAPLPELDAVGAAGAGDGARGHGDDSDVDGSVTPRQPGESASSWAQRRRAARRRARRSRNGGAGSDSAGSDSDSGSNSFSDEDSDHDPLSDGVNSDGSPRKRGRGKGKGKGQDKNALVRKSSVDARYEAAARDLGLWGLDSDSDADIDAANAAAEAEAAADAKADAAEAAAVAAAATAGLSARGSGAAAMRAAQQRRQERVRAAAERAAERERRVMGITLQLRRLGLLSSEHVVEADADALELLETAIRDAEAASDVASENNGGGGAADAVAARRGGGLASLTADATLLAHTDAVGYVPRAKRGGGGDWISDDGLAATLGSVADAAASFTGSFVSETGSFGDGASGLQSPVVTEATPMGTPLLARQRTSTALSAGGATPTAGFGAGAGLLGSSSSLALLALPEGAGVAGLLRFFAVLRAALAQTAAWSQDRCVDAVDSLLALTSVLSGSGASTSGNGAGDAPRFGPLADPALLPEDLTRVERWRRLGEPDQDIEAADEIARAQQSAKQKGKGKGKTVHTGGLAGAGWAMDDAPSDSDTSSNSDSGSDSDSESNKNRPNSNSVRDDTTTSSSNNASLSANSSGGVSASSDDFAFTLRPAMASLAPHALAPLVLGAVAEADDEEDTADAHTAASRRPPSAAATPSGAVSGSLRPRSELAAASVAAARRGTPTLTTPRARARAYAAAVAALTPRSAAAALPRPPELADDRVGRVGKTEPKLLEDTEDEDQEDEEEEEDEEDNVARLLARPDTAPPLPRFLLTSIPRGRRAQDWAAWEAWATEADADDATALAMADDPARFIDFWREKEAAAAAAAAARAEARERRRAARRARREALARAAAGLLDIPALAGSLPEHSRLHLERLNRLRSSREPLAMTSVTPFVVDTASGHALLSPATGMDALVAAVNGGNTAHYHHHAADAHEHDTGSPSLRVTRPRASRVGSIDAMPSFVRAPSLSQLHPSLRLLATAAAAPGVGQGLGAEAVSKTLAAAPSAPVASASGSARALRVNPMLYPSLLLSVASLTKPVFAAVGPPGSSPAAAAMSTAITALAPAPVVAALRERLQQATTQAAAETHARGRGAVGHCVRVPPEVARLTTVLALTFCVWDARVTAAAARAFVTTADLESVPPRLVPGFAPPPITVITVGAAHAAATAGIEGKSAESKGAAPAGTASASAVASGVFAASLQSLLGCAEPLILESLRTVVSASAALHPVPPAVLAAAAAAAAAQAAAPSSPPTPLRRGLSVAASPVPGSVSLPSLPATNDVAAPATRHIARRLPFVLGSAGSEGDEAVDAANVATTLRAPEAVSMMHTTNSASAPAPPDQSNTSSPQAGTALSLNNQLGFPPLSITLTASSGSLLTPLQSQRQQPSASHTLQPYQQPHTRQSHTGMLATPALTPAHALALATPTAEAATPLGLSAAMTAAPTPAPSALLDEYEAARAAAARAAREQRKQSLAAQLVDRNERRGSSAMPMLTQHARAAARRESLARRDSNGALLGSYPSTSATAAATPTPAAEAVAAAAVQLQQQMQNGANPSWDAAAHQAAALRALLPSVLTVSHLDLLARDASSTSAAAELFDTPDALTLHALCGSDPLGPAALNAAAVLPQAWAVYVRLAAPLAAALHAIHLALRAREVAAANTPGGAALVVLASPSTSAPLSAALAHTVKVTVRAARRAVGLCAGVLTVMRVRAAENTALLARTAARLRFRALQRALFSAITRAFPAPRIPRRAAHASIAPSAAGSAAGSRIPSPSHTPALGTPGFGSPTPVFATAPGAGPLLLSTHGTSGAAPAAPGLSPQLLSAATPTLPAPDSAGFFAPPSGPDTVSPPSAAPSAPASPLPAPAAAQTPVAGSATPIPTVSSVSSQWSPLWTAARHRAAQQALLPLLAAHTANANAVANTLIAADALAAFSPLALLTKVIRAAALPLAPLPSSAAAARAMGPPARAPAVAERIEAFRRWAVTTLAPPAAAAVGSPAPRGRRAAGVLRTPLVGSGGAAAVAAAAAGRAKLEWTEESARRPQRLVVDRASRTAAGSAAAQLMPPGAESLARPPTPSAPRSPGLSSGEGPRGDTPRGSTHVDAESAFNSLYARQQQNRPRGFGGLGAFAEEEQPEPEHAANAEATAAATSEADSATGPVEGGVIATPATAASAGATASQALLKTANRSLMRVARAAEAAATGAGDSDAAVVESDLLYLAVGALPPPPPPARSLGSLEPTRARFAATAPAACARAAAAGAAAAAAEAAADALIVSTAFAARIEPPQRPTGTLSSSPYSVGASGAPGAGPGTGPGGAHLATVSFGARAGDGAGDSALKSWLGGNSAGGGSGLGGVLGLRHARPAHAAAAAIIAARATITAPSIAAVPRAPASATAALAASASPSRPGTAAGGYVSGDEGGRFVHSLRSDGARVLSPVPGAGATTAATMRESFAALHELAGPSAAIMAAAAAAAALTENNGSGRPSRRRGPPPAELPQLPAYSAQAPADTAAAAEAVEAESARSAAASATATKRDWSRVAITPRARGRFEHHFQGLGNLPRPDVYTALTGLPVPLPGGASASSAGTARSSTYSTAMASGRVMPSSAASGGARSAAVAASTGHIATERQRAPLAVAASLGAAFAPDSARATAALLTTHASAPTGASTARVVSNAAPGVAAARARALSFARAQTGRAAPRVFTRSAPTYDQEGAVNKTTDPESVAAAVTVMPASVGGSVTASPELPDGAESRPYTAGAAYGAYNAHVLPLSPRDADGNAQYFAPQNTYQTTSQMQSQSLLHAHAQDYGSGAAVGVGGYNVDDSARGWSSQSARSHALSQAHMPPQAQTHAAGHSRATASSLAQQQLPFRQPPPLLLFSTVPNAHAGSQDAVDWAPHAAAPAAPSMFLAMGSASARAATAAGPGARVRRGAGDARRLDLSLRHGRVLAPTTLGQAAALLTSGVAPVALAPGVNARAAAGSATAAADATAVALGGTALNARGVPLQQTAAGATIGGALGKGAPAAMVAAAARPAASRPERRQLVADASLRGSTAVAERLALARAAAERAGGVPTVLVVPDVVKQWLQQQLPPLQQQHPTVSPRATAAAEADTQQGDDEFM